MKPIALLLATLMLALGGSDLRVLVLSTQPEMHCQNCETKIKENIRFVPGVKKIETSIERQQVTITYDAAKTDAQKIAAAFAKIGYKVQVVSDQPLSKKPRKQATQRR